MNYEVAGQGKTVVFLHGMTGSNQDWVNQVCLLTPNYRVVAPDMRGHGKSAAPLEEEKYSIPIFVEDVFKLLKVLDIKKCCLVGHSIGGFIALEFAVRHQDKLMALVLVDTSSGKIDIAPNSEQKRREVEGVALAQGLSERAL